MISLWVDNDAIYNWYHAPALLSPYAENHWKEKKTKKNPNQAHIWQNKMCIYGGLIWSMLFLGS